MGVSCEPHFLVKSIFVLFLRYFRFFSLFTPFFRCPFAQSRLPLSRFPAHTCAARSTLPYSLWLPFVRRPLQEDANAPTLYASRVTPLPSGDRKSTRLNSSHGYISYAVFCLKK